ncbi:MAG: LolA family protein [Gemmatimonadales bacterium]
MRQAFVALLLVVMPVALPAQQGDGNAIAARAARVYRSLASLSAEFTQVIDDEALGRLESHGTLVQSGQNKLAMRFTDPKGDAIVVDGKHVWVYTPSTTDNQVIRMPLPSGPVYGFNLMAWLLDRPTERYRITYLKREFVDFAQVDVLQFEPTSAQMPFRKAILWIDRDSGLPRKMEIEEEPGAVRTLTLTKLKTNQPVSEKTFRFDVPSGVRVVDQG